MGQRYAFFLERVKKQKRLSYLTPIWHDVRDEKNEEWKGGGNGWIAQLITALGTVSQPWRQPF